MLRSALRRRRIAQEGLALGGRRADRIFGGLARVFDQPRARGDLSVSHSVVRAPAPPGGYAPRARLVPTGHEDGVREAYSAAPG